LTKKAAFGGLLVLAVSLGELIGAWTLYQQLSWAQGLFSLRGSMSTQEMATFCAGVSGSQVMHLIEQGTALANTGISMLLIQFSIGIFGLMCAGLLLARRYFSGGRLAILLGGAAGIIGFVVEGTYTNAMSYAIALVIQAGAAQATCSTESVINPLSGWITGAGIVAALFFIFAGSLGLISRDKPTGTSARS
jgi:hypothetical protein